MELKPFLDELPRGGSAALAAAVGISTVYLFQLSARQGGREPGPELCVRIETATLKRVRRWDLRPTDWHLIWPELIGVEGAPGIPVAANDAVATTPAAGNA
jgi:DNA-binding transcriptional regulator YdaS (Cro superfamily)